MTTDPFDDARVRRVDELMWRASEARRQDDTETAQRMLAIAAGIEMAFALRLPATMPALRMTVAMSAVNLARQSGNDERARRMAAHFVTAFRGMGAKMIAPLVAAARHKITR